jgi:hypothetical protein
VRSVPHVFTEEEIASAVRQPSGVSEWLRERRREEIRRMSPEERAEEFQAHQRVLARFLEAGQWYRAQQVKK